MDCLLKHYSQLGLWLCFWVLFLRTIQSLKDRKVKPIPNSRPEIQTIQDNVRMPILENQPPYYGHTIDTWVDDLYWMEKNLLAFPPSTASATLLQ